MAQVIATGKWSKTLKKWTMVVSIRRPGKQGSTTDPSQGRRRPQR
jgi:hypothetical protein